MGNLEMTRPMRVKNKKSFAAMLHKDFIQHKYIYLIALPVIVYFFIFKYIPMYGAIIAFKNFSPGKGIIGSEWVGLTNFTNFFSSIYFFRVVRNTLLINLYGLIIGFPAPIILALMINEVINIKFKRVVQTVTYMPYFVSTVVVAGIILDFVSLNGIVNDILVLIGKERTTLMMNSDYFRTIYIFSDIWQGIGFGSIIYLASIAGIDQELYEASKIDGANKFRQVLHITLPGIAPTIVIMLILRIGGMMNLGFEKIILLYNPSIYETADVISSFVYRRGLLEFNFSYSTAVGLFNSVINCILLISANKISRKLQETSLW